MAGPLTGLKVLEFIRVPPGAFCTMMLADMGAEVLKIETPRPAARRQPRRRRRQRNGGRPFSSSTAASAASPSI